MNTIHRSFIEIDILENLDKCFELLEDCMDIDPIKSRISRLIDLVLYVRESIKHK